MAREFDVVVYGATGYTGRLVAEHFAKIHPDAKWAMAGRSQAKLAEVRSLIGAPASTPLIVADAADPAALAAMAKRAKAIVTTAGPYQLYGDALVAACAAQGTDYLDLAGEPHWIAAKIRDHDAAARATGARLVFSSGFDSVPFDIGAWYAQQQAKAKFGAYAKRVRGRVRAIRGGLSGGTAASGAATMAAAGKDPAVMMTLADPFAYTTGFKGGPQPDQNTPHQDELAGAWVVPFMMAMINSKAVHRTNQLLGHPWGTDFQYDEMQMVESKDAPVMGFSGGADMPKPGEGPTPEERAAGFYDLLFIAEMGDGRTLRAALKAQGDPGYGSTSQIIAEAALCLIETPRDKTPGGAWTPAAAMGDALIERLEKHARTKLSVEA